MEGEVKGKTFKMKGHTLPGINQRSETKNLADGRSPSSAFQQGMMSAAMGATGNIAGVMGATGRAQQRRNPITPGGVPGAVPGVFPLKPSVAKRYKKKGSTMGSYPSMRKIK